MHSTRFQRRVGFAPGIAVALLAISITGQVWSAAPPLVSNVHASQRAGTQLVDLSFDLADPYSSTLTVSVAVSTNAGASYSLPAGRFTGDIGNTVAPGANKLVTWNAGLDWTNNTSTQVRFRVSAYRGVSVTGAGGGSTLTFEALPTVAEGWATLSRGGASDFYQTTSALDAAVIADTSALAISNALASSSTLPPVNHAIAQFNAVGRFLQTAPTGNRYTVLMATILNSTGANLEHLTVKYDWDHKRTNQNVEAIPGHRVFFSLSGAPGTWTFIPSLSVFTTTSSYQKLTATLPLGAWPAASKMYIIWVDNNGRSTDAAYTIDNVSFIHGGTPNGIPEAWFSTDSNITTVNTRPVLGGSLLGQIFGGGASLTNAQIRVLDTPYATNSAVGGAFNLRNIPSGVGYVLTVSAPGYAINRFPNINISAGANNVGTLSLGNPVNLPVQLRPLVPDVNPAVTMVEEGGIAYRYYQVAAKDGRTLVGGVTVGLRRADGVIVPQDGDTSHEWAGSETGKPDADGLVRLRLPSSAIGAVESTATFEVLLGAVVAQIFTATVKPREYEQVWKQKAEGELSRSAGFRVGLNGSVASELRHELRGGTVTRESIGWKTEAQLELGYEKKVPDKGSVKFIGSGKIGFYIGYDYRSDYSFPPDTTDEDVNLEKIYASYVPFLKFSSKALRLLPGETAYEKMVNQYSASVLSRRKGTAWNGHVGGEGRLEGGGSVPSRLAENTQIEATAILSAEIGGFAGIEEVYGRDGDEAGQGVVFGFEVSTARGMKTLMQNIKFNGAGVRGLNINREFGFDASVKGRVWTPQTSLSPTRVDLEIARKTQSSGDFNVIAWRGLDLGFTPGEKVEMTETLSFMLPYPDYYNQWAAIGEVWALMGNYAETKLKAQPEAVSEFFSGILGDPYQRNQVVGYERRAYRALTSEFALSDQTKFLKRAFGLDLNAGFERGAEGRLESGVLWQLRRMPLESYPSVSSADYPSDKYWQKQEEWIRRGFPRFNAVVERVENFVDGVQDTIEVVGNAGHTAVLKVKSGVQQTGIWIGSTVSDWFVGPEFRAQGIGPKNMDVFPPEPLGNQVYGVGGLFRFESTNEFTGSATLTLTYTNSDIVGLNESELRIYRLGDGSNRWELIGGTVDLVAHSVSATITNLGTFAIAPPLPSGDLVLSIASNTLSADGLATSLITLSNLMLNNGQMATQLWLYTVAASGVEIVETDVTTNYSGVQLVSTNGMLNFTVRAPLGGHSAKVAVSSVAGDASGELGINLMDNAPPQAPVGVTVSAGKSRLFVAWQTNAEPDFAGYRVYGSTNFSVGKNIG